MRWASAPALASPRGGCYSVVGGHPDISLPGGSSGNGGRGVSRSTVPTTSLGWGQHLGNTKESEDIPDSITSEGAKNKDTSFFLCMLLYMYMVMSTSKLRFNYVIAQWLLMAALQKETREQQAPSRNAGHQPSVTGERIVAATCGGDVGDDH